MKRIGHRSFTKREAIENCKCVSYRDVPYPKAVPYRRFFLPGFSTKNKEIPGF